MYPHSEHYVVESFISDFKGVTVYVEWVLGYVLAMGMNTLAGAMPMNLIQVLGLSTSEACSKAFGPCVWGKNK